MLSEGVTIPILAQKGHDYPDEMNSRVLDKPMRANKAAIETMVNRAIEASDERAF